MTSMLTLTVSELTDLSPNISNLFDSLVDSLKITRLSIDEDEHLEPLRRQGEEISLRDDPSFRATPYGRWILAESYLANDDLYDHLNTSLDPITDLFSWLKEFDERIGRHTVFCPRDQRFVLTRDTLRLAEQELSDEPLVEPEVAEAQQYVTHLPLLKMYQAAYRDYWLQSGDDILDLEDASAVKPLGWIRVTLPAPLDRRMFIVRIEDDSMRGESDGVGRCEYAVFYCQSRESGEDRPVLVRGVDGQTGEGIHCLRQIRRDGDRVVLVPLSRQYPLFVFNEPDGDLLEVVAELTQVLTPGMYSRAPKGIEGIADCRTQHRQVLEMEAKVREFFEPGKVVPGKRWMDMSVRPICVKPGNGCLQVELGPFRSSPSSIRQLRLFGDGWWRDFDIERLRHERVRVMVPPWTTRLTWQAVGFEAEDGAQEVVDLTLPGLEGLSVDRATIFKLDREEVGRLVKDQRLALTESYRLLISPALLRELPVRPPVVPIESGWSIWELSDIATSDRMELVEQLGELGVELRQEDLQLEFVVVPPAERCRMGEENAYPSFLASTGAVINLMAGQGGALARDEGELVLLLVSDQGYQRQSLAAGGSRLLRLTDLRAGQYGVEVSDRRGDLTPARLFFEVVEHPPAYPRSCCRIALGGEWIELQAGKLLVLDPVDLRLLDEGEQSADELGLRIEAPAGWPLRVGWGSMGGEVLHQAHADQTGSYDIRAILAATRDRRHQLSVGEMILDLRELGRVALQHQRLPDVRRITEAMTELVIAHAQTVRLRRGEYLTTIPLWFEPVLALLGYSIADCPATAGMGNLRVLRLIHDEWTTNGSRQSVTRLLFLLEELTEELDPGLQCRMDSILSREQQRDSLLSDGLQWASRRFQSTLPVKARDLELVVGSPDAFLDFLREMGEGI